MAGARVLGIDSSPEMIARARAVDGVSFALGDAGGFDATGTDVLVSNAMLRWVLGHVPLLGRWADVWQTVNEQVLTGDDPVLAALDPEAAARFESQYAARLREAYPAAPYGTVFGFARTFVVARKHWTEPQDAARVGGRGVDADDLNGSRLGVQRVRHPKLTRRRSRLGSGARIACSAPQTQPACAGLGRDARWTQPASAPVDRRFHARLHPGQPSPAAPTRPKPPTGSSGCLSLVKQDLTKIRQQVPRRARRERVVDGAREVPQRPGADHSLAGNQHRNPLSPTEVPAHQDRSVGALRKRTHTIPLKLRRRAEQQRRLATIYGSAMEAQFGATNGRCR